MRQRDLEPWQQLRRQHVARLARDLDGSIESIAVSGVDADDVDVRIDHPVLEDVRALVQPTFDRFGALSSARRANLDDQVRRAHDVLAGEKRRGTLIRDVQQVGFDDVEHREANVEWGVEDLTERVLLKPVIDWYEPLGNPLMSDVKRRRHVVLPVDQFVPLPIFGEEQEVVVLSFTFTSPKRSREGGAGMSLIVDPGGATGTPQG